jgi:hypothetical protein
MGKGGIFSDFDAIREGSVVRVCSTREEAGV